MKRLLFVLLLTSTPAMAQQPNPAADAVAMQIGQLVLANSQAVAQLKALQGQVADLTKQRDEAIDKCGVPCEGMKQQPNKVKTETIPAPVPEKK